MHDVIHTWAAAWAVHPHAVADLFNRLGVGFEPLRPAEVDGGWSEAAISNKVRLDYAKAGIVLWRNNVGAYRDDAGGFVRYGLANDSAEMNKRVKSADLIGINNAPITQAMVGLPRGQFVAREVKRGDWKYTGDAHELAQLKFQQIVISKGGDAAFTVGS